MNLKKKAEFIIFRDGQLARGGDAFKHFRETNANNNKNHPTKLYGAWPHRPYNSRRGDLAPEMAKMVACHTPQDENIITWQQQPHLLDFAASTFEALMKKSQKTIGSLAICLPVRIPSVVQSEIYFSEVWTPSVKK